jgi:TIR domain
MPETAAHRIFVSYARSDADFVLRVAGALRGDGRHVWVDQLDIPKGARWDTEVEKALQACSCLLVVLSAASVKSQNVLDEVSYAIGEGRSVLPILLQPCSIPFRLKRLQYIDFTTDFGAGFTQLVAALDSLPPPEPGPGDESAAQAARPQPERADLPRATPPLSEAPGTAEAAGTTRRRIPKAVIGACIAAAVVVVYLIFASPTPDVPRSAPSREPEARVAPTVESSPPAAQAEQPRPAPPTAEPPAITNAMLTAFVDRYIDAENRANAELLLAFYDERVDYFGQKSVGKDFILKDKQAYYRRWPVVENRRTSEIGVQRLSGEEGARVSYAIRYQVSNPNRSETKSGAANDELTLRFADGRLLIAGQRQQFVNATN